MYIFKRFFKIEVFSLDVFFYIYGLWIKVAYLMVFGPLKGLWIFASLSTISNGFKNDHKPYPWHMLYNSSCVYARNQPGDCFQLPLWSNLIWAKPQSSQGAYNRSIHAFLYGSIYRHETSCFAYQVMPCKL